MADTLHISDIQLFNLLKNKLGEKEAEQLVDFVKTQVKEEATIAKEHATEIIHKDIAALKDYIDVRLSHTAGKEDIVKLEIKIARTESKLILWAFVFWATQLAAIFAFLKIFIR